VISIPREFEAHGYTPGTSVLVEELDGGELRILSTQQLRERIRTIGERVVAEHPEALEILAEHDPNSESAPQFSTPSGGSARRRRGPATTPDDRPPRAGAVDQPGHSGHPEHHRQGQLRKRDGE
jgi:hypothetical protein